MLIFVNYGFEEWNLTFQLGKSLEIEGKVRVGIFLFKGVEFVCCTVVFNLSTLVACRNEIYTAVFLPALVISKGKPAPMKSQQTTDKTED